LPPDVICPFIFPVGNLSRPISHKDFQIGRVSAP
jgi:hypothetical protein